MPPRQRPKVKATPESVQAGDDRAAEVAAQLPPMPADQDTGEDDVPEGTPTVGPPVIPQDIVNAHEAAGTPLPPVTDPLDNMQPTPPAPPTEDPEGEGKWILFNPTDSPVTIDDEGHFVGGGERVQVDRIDQRLRDHIAAGRIVKTRAPRRVTIVDDLEQAARAVSAAGRRVRPTPIVLHPYDLEQRRRVHWPHCASWCSPGSLEWVRPYCTCGAVT